MLRLLQLLPCNAHEISELQLNTEDVGNSVSIEIGAGIYSTLSLFNHSCYPAVTRHFHGDTCVVRTIRAVREGDSVDDNYGTISELHDGAQRRLMLSSQYYFDCDCVACLERFPQYDILANNAEAMRWRCLACNEEFKDHDEEKCSKKLDVGEESKKLMQQYNESSKNYQQGFQHLLKGEWRKATPLFIQHLQMMDNVKPPHVDICNAQESLKQAYNIMGNCTEFSMDTLPKMEA